jgi:hexosaminidase
VYAFNPVPSVLNEAEQKYILGLEGCLWSEFVDNPNLLEYMVYPRMFAIAETGWVPAQKKDFNGFLSRLEIVKKRYDAIGINYFKGEYRNVKEKKE